MKAENIIMKSIKTIGLFLILIFLISSCKPTEQIVVEQRTEEIIPKPRGIQKDKLYSTVKTYFATDRKAIASSELSDKIQFSGEKGSVQYGTCDVSIPASHVRGNIERPSIWKLELTEDPNKHVVVLKAKTELKKNYFNELKSDNSKKAFIFVHGYFVSFEEAAQRTAQMAYDLNFPGLPIFYSWPSQSTKVGYWKDSETVEACIANIQNFVKDVIETLPNHDIYLVGHSMGTRAMSKAVIQLLEKHPEYEKQLKAIILSAPDIDAEIFKNEIAPKLAEQSDNVTLYASSDDHALELSAKINGVRRAGEITEEILLLDGIEVIDASNADTGFSGHSYFGDSKMVIRDIGMIIYNGLKASARNTLTSERSGQKTYWKLGGQ